jgi:hypothetical protein
VFNIIVVIKWSSAGVNPVDITDHKVACKDALQNTIITTVGALIMAMPGTASSQDPRLVGCTNIQTSIWVVVAS